MDSRREEVMEAYVGLAMQGLLANPSLSTIPEDVIARRAVAVAKEAMKELNAWKEQEMIGS